MQPTMFGEPDGQITPRLKEIVSTFKQAGFPVALSRNMDAWQKTHVALISPIANALYMAGVDNYRLEQMPESLHLMVSDMGEGFKVLRELGIPITTSKLKLWEWLPETILVVLLKRWAKTKHFEIVVARHANAARDEMQQLAAEFKVLTSQTSVATLAIDRLDTYIDLHQPDSFGIAHT